MEKWDFGLGSAHEPLQGAPFISITQYKALRCMLFWSLRSFEEIRCLFSFEFSGG